MTWSPDQYLKFAQPRLRPALELLARVQVDDPATVFDLGCGTGAMTRMMAERWPMAVVTGVDASESMLAKVAGAPDTPGNVRWHQQDLARWEPGDAPGLIYSNAALHWLPDHPRLFARLFGSLAAGGVLAVQMPRNFEAPSHTAVADTVLAGPWRDRLEPLLRPVPVADPGWYFDLLARRGAQIDLWETEYHQVLTGPDPVKEWTKGTWLGPFLDALDGDERDAFEREYAARVRAAYPMRDDGSTVFPFRRLFIVARKG